MAVDARAAWMPARARVLVALALAPALAGCGGSSSHGNGVVSKPPARIVAIATADATAAASVHVAGSILSEGKPISLNMELDAEKGGQGQVTLGDLSIDVVNVDRAVYVKAGSAFYSRFAGPAAARVLQGKWLRGSNVSGPLASFTSLTELRKLLSATLAAHGALSRSATTTVSGQQAVGVTDAAGGGTLYVASTGTPYPLEIVKRGAGAGKLVFDRWNQPVSLAVPPNPVNLDQLQHRR
ncbi:MAG: hypothetical protein JWN10_1582 [Solirubrobacterales bacterium]|nr:hypothetical protein [Solirubrobacterales bacterium]